MPAAWRIVKQKHAAQAFDGAGARRNGGRWNSPGTRVVYAAHSASLAILEILVHLQRTAALPSYVLFAAHFTEAQAARLDRRRLPAAWRAYPPPPELQALGDDWARSASSLVLEVPSALVPHESNFLINPAHPEFAALPIDPPLPFDLDQRLLRR